MKKADGLFFDLGGTLLLEIKDASYQDGAKKALYDLVQPESDPDTFYEMIRERFAIYKSWAVHTRREVTDDLLWGLFLLPERDASWIHEHAHEMTYIFRRTKGRRVTVPGGVEVVRILKERGYRLGIISNLIGEDYEVRKWLKSEEMEDLFETMVISSVCGLRKPGDGIYRIACSNLNLSPARCASIADNLDTDIPGARKAGIGVNVLYHSPEGKHVIPITDFNRPDYEIRDFRELLEIFD